MCYMNCSAVQVARPALGFSQQHRRAGGPWGPGVRCARSEGLAPVWRRSRAGGPSQNIRREALFLFQAEVSRPAETELRSAAGRAAEIGGQSSRPRQGGVRRQQAKPEVMSEADSHRAGRLWLLR